MKIVRRKVGYTRWDHKINGDIMQDPLYILQNKCIITTIKEKRKENKTCTTYGSTWNTISNQ